VTHNLASVSERDVRAIAVYIASLATEPTLARRKRSEDILAYAKRAQTSSAAAPRAAAADAPQSQSGAAIYAGACAMCHDNGRAISSAGALNLALSTAVTSPTPGNLIHIIVQGIEPREGERGRWMPAFAGALTAEQLADLTAYLRSEFGMAPAWRNVDAEVRKVMRGKE